MSTRSIKLTKVRTEIPTGIINDVMTKEERFQNSVLRPTIKFQKDLLIEVFKNYIVKHKSMFYDLALEKRMDYIENAIQKDMKFRNSLKGMIIGVFTVEEYLIYIENSSSLNKRMMHLVKELLLSNIQLFEASNLLAAV